MKNLNAFCLAFLFLIGTTLTQRIEADSETETGLFCNLEGEDACQSTGNLGLRTYDGQALNLNQLNTSVYIEAGYALVEHTLVYDNNLNEASNLVFYYNKPANALVNDVNATWNDRDVDAELINSEDAEDSFQALNDNTAFNILARGVPAFLLGRVPAGSQVTVKFSVIQPLALVANKYWAFSLYSSLAPNDNFKTRNWNDTVDWDDTILEDADLSNWNLKVDISTRRALTVVLNPTQNLNATRTQNNNRFSTSWDASIGFDKDFVVLFTYQTIHNPTYILTKHPTLSSDWIFGYSVVPQASTLSADDIASRILGSSSVGELDQNASSTLISNIRSSCSCNNTQGAIIFTAESTDASFGSGSAYDKFFYLRNLVNPDGCRLNVTYFNNNTRTTYLHRYSFYGFSQARTTDEWHKIAYSERIEELETQSEDGRSSQGNADSEDITDLAVRYQIEAEGTTWVTVDVDNNRTILEDSLKYHFAPEAESNAEGNETGEEGEVGDDGLNEEAETEADNGVTTTTTNDGTTITVTTNMGTVTSGSTSSNSNAGGSGN